MADPKNTASPQRPSGSWIAKLVGGDVYRQAEEARQTCELERCKLDALLDAPPKK